VYEPAVAVGRRKGLGKGSHVNLLSKSGKLDPESSSHSPDYSISGNNLEDRHASRPRNHELLTSTGVNKSMNLEALSTIDRDPMVKITC